MPGKAWEGVFEMVRRKISSAELTKNFRGVYGPWRDSKPSREYYRKYAYAQGFRAQWDAAPLGQSEVAVYREAVSRKWSKKSSLSAFVSGKPIPDAYSKKGEPRYWVAGDFTTAGGKRQSSRDKQRKPSGGRKYRKPAQGRRQYVPAWTMGVQIRAGSSVGGVWSKKAIPFEKAFKNFIKQTRKK